jgi:hypothetical protein
VPTSGRQFDGVLHPFRVNHINSCVSTRRLGRLWWESAADSRRLGVPSAASPVFMVW